MSKNRNRAKLNKAHNNKEYRYLQIGINYPIYWDEGIISHSKKKFLMSFKMRSYKTWKHNRLNQWKKRVVV